MNPRTMALLSGFLFLFSSPLLFAAVENMSVSKAATGIDKSPEDGFLDWFDGYIGKVGDDGDMSFITAAEFVWLIPPGSKVHSASLTLCVTNPGSSRQIEMNIFRGGNGIGFGAMVMRGSPQQWTIPAGTNFTIQADVTPAVSGLVGVGASGFGFNLRETPPSANYYNPMILQMNSAAPMLVVDYDLGPPPEGHYHYDFGATNGPLWDFAHFLPADPSQQANGRLTGYKATGLVRGSARGLTVRWTYKEPSGISDYDRYSYLLNLDPVNGTLFGTKTHKQYYVTCDTLIGPCHGHTIVNVEQTVLPLGNAQDGSWTLDLAISRKNSALIGYAHLGFPNGDIFPLTLKGKYLDKVQQARLSLTGAPANPGPTFAVTLSVSDMTLQSIRGKALGQVVSWPP